MAVFCPQAPPPHSSPSFPDWEVTHSLRGLSRRLGTFCKCFAFSSLSSVHYEGQQDLRREPRRKEVLVFVTRAANVTIHIETSSSFFQARRHIVRYGLDWIGCVKHGIELVKAKTPFLVLRILMVHIKDKLGSRKFESVCLTCLVDCKLTVVQSLHVFF